MTTMPLASNQDRQNGGRALRASLTTVLLGFIFLLAACGEFAGGESGETAAPQQLTGGAGGAASEAAFQATVYQLTTANCGGSGCHSTTRSPLHAHPVVSTAHSAVLTKSVSHGPTADFRRSVSSRWIITVRKRLRSASMWTAIPATRP